MLANFDTVHHYSIKHLLQSVLQASVGLYRDRLEVSAHQVQENPSATTLDFNSEHIPLNRAIDDTRILYVSAIAFKLAAIFKQPPIIIATELCSYLSSKQILSLHYSDALLQTYTFEVVPPGWLHFQLTGSGVAVWLQYLLEAGEAAGDKGDEQTRGRGDAGTRRVERDLRNSQLSTVTSQQSKIQNLSPIFRLQYVHARCCSLLRLGQREGLIKLSESPVWQILEPQPISWLSDKEEFYLVNLAEWHLIAEIFGLIDDISDLNQNNLLKLVDAFENFYSKCRIFGAVKRDQPQLAQARLGLVMVARLAVQLLLQKRLGILPLLEL